MPAMSAPPSAASLQRVEAARYALLRRMTVAMRDHMVAQLQPIAPAARQMQQRLQDAPSDVQAIAGDMAQLHGFARNAVAANLDMVSWLAPEAGATATVDAGAGDCLGLLGDHLRDHGWTVRLEPGAGLPVPRHALRTVLAAVLLALADEKRAPAELVLRPEGTRLRLRWRSAPDAAAGVAPPSYRPLAWEDAQALAAAEEVQMEHSEDAMDLRFPPP